MSGLSISSFMSTGKEKNKTEEEKLSLAHEFFCRFMVIKVHSWRGKLKRIFCVGKNTVATIDPSALFKLTNEWKYGSGLLDALPKSSPNEWTISVSKKSGSETMTFSSPDRAEILTELQKQRKKFARDNTTGQVYGCKKYHWNEDWSPSHLCLAAHGVQQVDPTTVSKVFGCYEYWMIREIGRVEDTPGSIFIRYSDNERLHLYQCDRADDLTRKIVEMAKKYIGHTAIKTGGSITLHEFESSRLGVDVSPDSLMSVSEFSVAKKTPRHELPIRRSYCICDRYIVERDPATYNVVTVRRLVDVFALIRCEEDTQKFVVEFKDNCVKTYTSTDRDSLLASLLDAVRRAGNLHCCIKMSRTDRGQRTGSIRKPVPEAIESTLLKVMGEYDVKADKDILTYPQLVRYFNNNVEYSGLLFTETKDALFAENKERMIATAITALLVHAEASPTPEEAADQYYALRRLAASKTGFEAFTRIPGFVRTIGRGIVAVFKMKHDAVSHAAIDFLAALLYPMHDKYDITQEVNNRLQLLDSPNFLNNLVTLLKQHALANTGALVVSALLDFFVFSLCPPYSDTTNPQQFAKLLGSLAEGAGPAMFRLFLHPCMALGIASGMLMKTIIQECDSQAKRLQRYALSEGTLLRQFYNAIWSKNPDIRELAIQLIGLWTIDCPEAQELLKRMVPVALLSFLQHKSPKSGKEITTGNKKKLRENGMAAYHWRIKMGIPTPAPQPPDQPPVTLRKPKELVQVCLNWELFFEIIQKDHLRPDVIWNHHTREELRECIERELALLSQGTDTRRGHEVAWNHVEFEVLYECLKDEIQIGNHFLKLLLEDPNPQIHNPKEFFYDLYHRFLLVNDGTLKAQCMHGMARLYETFASEIGVFNDLSFMVNMLKNSTDKLERDRLLQFLSNLLRVKGNVKLFIDCHGVPILIDLLTLAHLHHDRAQLRTQSNVIEMNPTEELGSEPEWYWQDENGEQQGPVSLETVKEMYTNKEIDQTTRIWAQGLDAWHQLQQVPQLRWTLVYPQPGCLNPTELSCLVLDMLNRMCAFYPTRNEDGVLIRPVPRIKRMLAEPTVLPHVVQLLLTLDPGLVSRTATLLCSLMEDNPSVVRLYLTGVYYFALMYMGSDIRPICKLFTLTHDKQAFKSEEGNSVLSPMLPKAMVCFLTNYGTDKFAEVFLGEFDNPEAIWGNEMRQHLVQQIALHLMEFTPKLRSNTRAIYTYCPIPPIAFKQLENELFCNIYYLKHLCDVDRFPEWPIEQQVELLRDTLTAWKVELEKKGQPVGISKKQAYEELELDPEIEHEQSKLKKAYFILAAKFHPDKNPDGRERFEAILKAYEFLSNPNHPMDTPDPRRIDLLIRTQSILYRRFKELLSPYKYAGYPMLLNHVEQEANDPQLFALETPLLPSAAELCLHTVNASPLNAEELLREGGIDLLRQALERCADVVSSKSEETELPVLVSMRVIETFSVAANFEICREKMQTMPRIVELVCKGITCTGAPKLAKASIVCSSAFAAGEELQDLLYKYGVLWHLLTFIFGYDFTLDEGGIEKSAETNLQELKNIQAKAATFTICRLCGFMPDTKPHAGLTQTLAMVLTPYVVNKLRIECKGELAEGEPTVLKLLNGNSETPYMLWNNGTRTELVEFLERMQEAALKGEEVDATFEYSAHQKELFVGGVFVRLYNEQPHFALTEPASVVGACLRYIDTQVPLTTPGEPSDRMSNITSCMEAVRNVLSATPAVVDACFPHLKMIFSLFEFGTEELSLMTAEALILCTQNHDCVLRVAEESVLAPLLICMARHRATVVSLLNILLALASTTKCVSEMLEKGAYVLALYEFCTTRMPEIREAACQYLGKLVTDKLHGPKVSLRSGKIIPAVFIETMKENAATVAMMFDSTTENPELIWTNDMRDKSVHVCSELRESVVSGLKENPQLNWRLPDDIGKDKGVDEYEVGGVYLGLYVKQPGWALRNPKKFMTSLFEEYLTKSVEDPIPEEIIDLLSRALVCLLNAQPVLADQVPQLGHLPKIFFSVGQARPVVSHASVQILHQLALCRTVVETMGQTDCVRPLLKFLKHDNTSDEMKGQTIETIERMMKSNNCEHGCIVKRALDCDLVEYLMSLLESQTSSAVRAVTVKALKAMSNGSSPNCQIVREQLNSNPRWDSYQSQNHDLFLTKQTFAGYLTGPGSESTGAMLSLTSGPSTNNASAAHSNAPPPIKDKAVAAAAAMSTGPPPVDSPKKETVSNGPPPVAAKTEPSPPSPKEEKPKAVKEEAKVDEPKKEEPKVEEPKNEPEQKEQPKEEAKVEEPKKAPEQPKEETKVEEPKQTPEQPKEEPKEEVKQEEAVKEEEPEQKEVQKEEPKEVIKEKEPEPEVAKEPEPKEKETAKEEKAAEEPKKEEAEEPNHKDPKEEAEPQSEAAPEPKEEPTPEPEPEVKEADPPAEPEKQDESQKKKHAAPPPL